MTSNVFSKNSLSRSNKRTPEQISEIRWLPGASYCVIYPTSCKKFTSHFDEPWQPVSSLTNKPIFTLSNCFSNSKQIKIPHLSSPPIPVGFPSVSYAFNTSTRVSSKVLPKVCGRFSFYSLTTILSILVWTVSVWAINIG